MLRVQSSRAAFKFFPREDWADSQTIADLADGPVTVAVGDVTVSLTIDAWGEPALRVSRGGKCLKSIPAGVKKHPKVVELRARKCAIQQQVWHMRRSLEQAMWRGDTFTGAELWTLVRHPLLAPMLEQLVFIGDSTLGYPVGRAQVLQDHTGRLFPVRDSEMLYIAHPFDLLATREWHLWQRECFVMERIQPFKQVFRELYLPTATEAVDGKVSHRFAGQQIEPQRVVALLGRRGWDIHPAKGIRRTFPHKGIVAWLKFLREPATPGEADNLTIQGIYFTNHDAGIGNVGWEAQTAGDDSAPQTSLLPLVTIPPRLFSEVIRDLEWVIRVAHRGGVDPEANIPSVELRASVVRQTCAMLNLDNVQILGQHAMIKGRRGSYAVHLGSGVAQRQAGGVISVVPVRGQHRGRLFLPFADDDPRTAEVVSKVLLLARDSEIGNPTILEQILA